MKLYPSMPTCNQAASKDLIMRGALEEVDTNTVGLLGTTICGGTVLLLMWAVNQLSLTVLESTWVDQMDITWSQLEYLESKYKLVPDEVNNFLWHAIWLTELTVLIISSVYMCAK